MNTPSDLIADFTNETLVWDEGSLHLVENIGKGGMGVVYRAVDESDMAEYAVKILLKADPKSIEGQCQTREIVMHQIASDHPNVLTLHKVINRDDDQYIFLVLDYCPGGDLFMAISETQDYVKNDYLTKKVFIQILDAVQSIHDKGIYHRDLKPDNILVNKEGTEIFLCDFGLATDVTKCQQFRCGSNYYMSPECIGEMPFGTRYPDVFYEPEKSDIWALGVILLNMITKRNPWNRASYSDPVFRAFWKDNNLLKTLLPISTSTYLLMSRVFELDPDERISLAEFREAVLDIDNFLLSEKEVAGAPKNAKVVAKENIRESPATSAAPTSAPVESVAEIQAPAIMLTLSEDEYLYPSPDPYSMHLVSEDGNTRFTIGSVSSEDISSASSSFESNPPLIPEAVTKTFSSEVDVTDAALSFTFDKLSIRAPLQIVVTAA